MTTIPSQPLAEVFGFRVDDLSDEATRYRRLKLCPFHNKAPNCTKDKANDPLGVCSIHYLPSGHDAEKQVIITCPVRFRQSWSIAEDAAAFFFPSSSPWTSLQEVKLEDRNGASAGNIDYVLVAYDKDGVVTDFGALEVQSVYISGNVRRPFEHYIEDPVNRMNMDWAKLGKYYPRPDFLSSSRKRLVPQLLYKGGILNTWGKKQAIALQRSFFETLPKLPQVSPKDAEIAWLLYDLKPGPLGYELVLSEVVYTGFVQAMSRITVPQVGDIDDFMVLLQGKLDQIQLGNEQDTATLTDIMLQ